MTGVQTCALPISAAANSALTVTEVATVVDNMASIIDVSTNMASVTGATTQAATATNQAGVATTQASNAATSAGIATTQATTATTKAGEAAASAGASATSASAALTSEQNADVSEASALAAKVAAESARDAAIIGAGVYVDEPTGRAAVANGVAFKVQGSGDVAAYEYRRTSASASVLIATYPSNAALESRGSVVNDPWAPLWLASVEADSTGNISNWEKTDGERAGGSIDASTQAAINLRKLIDGMIAAQARNMSLNETAPIIGTAQSTAIAGFQKAWLHIDNSAYFENLGGTVVYPVTGNITTAATIVSAVNDGVTLIGRGGFKFLTDAPELVVCTSYNSTPGTAVYVDGVFIGTSTSVSGELNYWKLTFPSRRVREVLLLPGQAYVNGLIGVYTTAIDRVSATKTKTLTTTFEGDSYVQGAGVPHWYLSYYNLVSQNLGFKDTWNTAMGGTGLLAKGPGSASPNYRERIASIVAANPALHIFNISVNDSGAAPSAMATELTLYLQALRAALPSLLVVVTGCAAASLGPTQNVIDIETECAAAITALGDSKVVFIPVSTDPSGPWIFGTGYANSTNGSGNSDIYIGTIGSTDSTHPGVAGHAYLADRLTSAIKNKFININWSI